MGEQSRVRLNRFNAGENLFLAVVRKFELAWDLRKAKWVPEEGADTPGSPQAIS
jgi:hypothetical protein